MPLVASAAFVLAQLVENSYDAVACGVDVRIGGPSQIIEDAQEAVRLAKWSRPQ